MRPVEVRVLGPVEVVGSDGRIALAAKQRRLLAALVLAAGRVCSVDELVEAVWDRAPPASARKLVQVYVSQLRKALPAGVAIETRPGGYVAAVSPAALDAARFEQLLGEARVARDDGNPALALSLADQALALWRGRAFGELAYEELARAESERLEELRSVAVEERIEARLELGQHGEVVGDVLVLAQENPFRDRLQQLAMLALYRCGRQSEALDHYSALRARLDRELGLEPGAGLRDLQRRILQHDPALELGAEPRHAMAPLPTAPNPLVGRARELDELRALLEHREARFLVLTGAGGSGKTRLALEAARLVAGSYANGAVVVELAPLRDPALVVPTIAHAVGVADVAGENQLETLSAALAPLELLLVLDNAEHVREAAPQYARLLARASRLTLLVTSRAVLHVSGERVFPVAPLPDEDAVELFVQRARLLHPSFELTPSNEEDVHEICRRVDGLPLAIELAAARTRTLTPHVLRHRLDARLTLLTGGPRDLPARQQTLRETIDWSVDLLDDRARFVLGCLAVFPGGATLAAAETVCGADLDTLAALVDVHLVRRDDVRGELRFGMLETVREYAFELLGDRRADVELALAAYFAQLVDDLRLSEGTKDEWRRAVEQLEPEAENARVALAAAAAADDAELLLRLAGGLWRYWWVRGSVGEGLAWIERALGAGHGPRSVARARALYGAAALAWSRSDLERAREWAEAAMAVAVDAGSEWYELAAHTILGNVAQKEGDLSRARHHHECSLALKERLGLEPLVEKLNLGTVALDSGEHEKAMALFEDVLEAYRRDGDPVGIGMALLNTGRVHLELGDAPAARRDFEEARSCFSEIGFRSHVAYALQGLAAAEAGEARFVEAAQLLGRARRELDEVGSSEDVSAPEMVARVKEQARAALGDAAYEDAFAGRLDLITTGRVADA